MVVYSIMTPQWRGNSRAKERGRANSEEIWKNAGRSQEGDPASSQGNDINDMDTKVLADLVWSGLVWRWVPKLDDNDCIAL